MTTPSARYRAFISYSHADKAVVAWLHRTLEAYRLPTRLVGLSTAFGPAPGRLTPIFRDRDELPASGNLGRELNAALSEALFLVVVCSPASAQSHWVNEEVLAFKRLHGEDRVLALIVSGEPGASGIPSREPQECFPPALRFRLAANGALGREETSPIAADLRSNGDGRRLAVLKLVAGLTGIPLDNIVQREAQRRVQRLTAVVAATTVGMIAAGALALYANERRIDADQQRKRAEQQAAAARAASDFLIGTFAVANPATENPRTVSALTLLTRGAERANKELATQPLIRLKLLTTVGKAYANLGLFDEARKLLEREAPVARTAGEEGASAILQLAVSYLKLGRIVEARAAVADALKTLSADGKPHLERQAYAEEVQGWIEGATTATAPKALAHYDRALALYEKAGRLTAEARIYLFNQKGVALYEIGDYAAARRALTLSKDLIVANYGNWDMKTGQAYLALATNELTAGNAGQAKSDLTTAVNIYQRVLEPTNPWLADVYIQLGQVYEGEHNSTLARDTFLKARQIYKASPGPRYQIGIADVFIGLAESELGHTAKALDYMAEAKVEYDIGYQHLDMNHGDLLINTAVVLNRVNRKVEAKADCLRGLEILKETLPEDHPYQKTYADLCRGLNIGL